MLLSFPIQGYALISITFSTMHIICSYVFAWWFWKDLKESKTFSTKMIKTALVFMVFSTIGVWAMGPLMTSSLRGSAWYYMAVQFYIHFQFNGWFIFAILAIFFTILEKQKILLKRRLLPIFYLFIVVSCFLTYALAVAWAKPLFPVFLINSTGVLFQLTALTFFLLIIWDSKRLILASFPGIKGILLRTAFFSFVVKILAQTFVVLPFFAKVAYTIRNYVIGFIHLILLGAVTCFILAYALEQNQLSMQSRLSKVGLWVIIAGFILSEFVLFLQGTMFWGTMGFLPKYYELLFSVSALIPLGVFLFGLSQTKNLSSAQNQLS